MSKIVQLRHKLASAKGPEIQKISRMSLARSTNEQDQTNYEKIIQPFKEQTAEETNENKPKCFDDSLVEEPLKKNLTSFEASNNQIQLSTDNMDNPIASVNRNNQAPNNTSRGPQVPTIFDEAQDYTSFRPPASAISGVSRQTRVSTARRTPKHFVPAFHEPNFKLSQTKVQHFVRQSTRNRFSNIYKTDDDNDEIENLNNKNKNNQTSSNNTSNNNSTNNNNNNNGNNLKDILSKAAVNSLENMNNFTR